jgi:hypothetical protein
MWVRANNEINAAINQPTGEFAFSEKKAKGCCV